MQSLTEWLALKAGHDVVVVVSAMSGNQSVAGLAKEIQSNPTRELDALLSTGEKVTTALLSMALGERSVRRSPTAVIRSVF